MSSAKDKEERPTYNYKLSEVDIAIFEAQEKGLLPTGPLPTIPIAEKAIFAYILFCVVIWCIGVYFLTTP